MGAPRIDSLEKNYIINGNFDFWQRGTGQVFSGTGTATGYLWADRFAFSASTTNNRVNRAVNRSTDVPTFAESGFKSTYSLEYSQTSALTLAAGDWLIAVRQKVEGIFYRQLHGKTVTLSFWFKSTVAGQYPVAFVNGATDRSYVTLFTYSSANVWQKIYITLTTDVGGSWLFNNGVGLDIIIGADSGGVGDAPSLNSWLSGFYYTTSSGLQVQAQSSITYRIAQLQLIDVDVQAASFSMAGRGWLDELTLCQRYYEKSYDLDVVPGTLTDLGRIACHSATAFGAMSNLSWFSQRFKVKKRAAPIVVPYASSAANQPNRFSDSGGTTRICLASEIGQDGWAWKHADPASTNGFFVHYTADAEL